ncbi:MAG: hypothetical protein HY060_10710 [Proteobacteria bacterium]|nr:hypothetical protein [Pseudomonadota bacterium]
MRLKNVGWSTDAGAYYLRLLTNQRRAIDALIRELREAAVPGPAFRQLDDYPGYWFAKTSTDVLMVVERRGEEDYAVKAFRDWRQQLDLAVEEAAAALAEADVESPQEIHATPAMAGRAGQQRPASRA